MDARRSSYRMAVEGHAIDAQMGYDEMMDEIERAFNEDVRHLEVDRELIEQPEQLPLLVDVLWAVEPAQPEPEPVA